MHDRSDLGVYSQHACHYSLADFLPSLPFVVDGWSKGSQREAITAVMVVATAAKFLGFGLNGCLAWFLIIYPSNGGFSQDAD